MGVGGALSVVSLGIQVYQIIKGPKGNKHDGSRLEDSKITASTIGAPIQIGYGTVRMGGNIIWAGELKEVKNKESVGKGGSKTTTFSYYRSFAVGLAHPAGTTPRLLKIWADGKLIYDATGTGLFQKRNLRVSFYDGSETQDVDPIIEADVGTDNAPAYRGLCYLVVDDLPMADYGNRMPNLTFLVTFEGTDDYTLSQSTQTLNAWDGWVYSRRFQRAYYIAKGTAAGDVDCFEYNLITDTIRKVTSSLPAGESWNLVTGLNDLFDSSAVDNLGNIYIGGQWGTNYPGLIKIDPITLRVSQTLKLSGGANAGPYALLFYDNPTWSPSASGGVDVFDYPGNEFVLCAMATGRFQWVRAENGAMELSGAPFFPINGQSDGALQMVKTVYNDVIAIQGAIATGFVTQRHLNEIVVTQPPLNPQGTFPVFAATHTYDATLEIQSMRFMAYDGPNRGLIVFNDVFDNSQDLPDGDGFVRYDVSSWPPNLTAQKSDFVDGIESPHNEHIKHHVDNGWLMFSGYIRQVDPNIYFIDSVTLDLVKGYDSNDWYGSPTALRDRMWDVDGNSYLTKTGSNSLDRIFFDRSSSGSIDLDQVVADLCSRVGIPANEIDVTDLELSADSRNSVRGYMLSRRSSAASALEQLMAAYFFDAVESDFVLKFRRRAGTDVDTGITIPQSDLGVDENHPAANYVKIKRAQPSEIPTKYEVKFFDINAEYQEAAAPAQRGSTPLQPALGDQRQQVDFPLGFTTTEAKRLAERLLFSAAVESAGIEVSTFPKYLALDPTDKVTIETDTRSFSVRIESSKIGENFDIQISAILTDTEIFGNSEIVGQENDGVTDSTLQPDVAARFYPIDSNLFRDADEGTAGIPVYFAMLPNESSGWRGGVIYGSTNNTEYLPVITYPDGSTGGAASTELPSVDRWTTWDRTSTLTVALHYGSLSSSTEALVLNGANAALLGGEIIQFVNASDNGDGTWDLDTFLRARRGTNWAVGLHHEGERFILLDTTLRKTEADLAAIGGARYYRGVSVGEPITNTPVRSLLIEAKALRPYSGMQPVRVLKDGGNDAYLSWYRRSRLGGANDWADAIEEIPVGETILEFEVDLVDANDSAVVSATKHSSITELKVGAGGVGQISVAPNTPSAGIARYSYSGHSFSSDGFVAGDLVRCESFDNAGNRGTLEVSAVGTTTIDLFNPNAVTESSGFGKIIVRPAEAVLFTAAEQTAAGYSAGGELGVKIYQLSATVGRGFALEATI